MNEQGSLASPSFFIQAWDWHCKGTSNGGVFLGLLTPLWYTIPVGNVEPIIACHGHTTRGQISM